MTQPSDSRPPAKKTTRFDGQRDVSPSVMAHLPLTPAVFQILLALAEGPRHGYAVIVDVRERTGGTVRLGTGTLYAAVKRLLDRDWIEETEEPAQADAVGSERSRRYYQLTELGREVARAEAERLAHTVEVARSRALLDGAQR